MPAALQTFPPIRVFPEDFNWSAWIWPAVICSVFAALEALAGHNVKGRLNELRMPRFAPPLWLWVVIGGLYYVTFFLILRRLFTPFEPLFPAVFMTVFIMFLNTLWTFLFFRRTDLSTSTVIAALYVPAALGLALTLWMLDRTALAIFAPYMIYLFYATWWSYRVWKDNSPSQAI